MTTRSEDINLATDQYSELNRDFYSAGSGPSGYLTQRFRALLLSSGVEALVERARDMPFDHDSIEVGSDVAAALPPESRDFMTVESTVLLHHSAEALFRMFLAHRGLPPCPWLECARQRLPNFEFNKAVRDLDRSLSEAATTDALMEVFFGTHQRPGQYGDKLTVETWNDQRDGLTALFGAAGRLLMADGGLYNAAKHGLAIVAGATSTSVERAGGSDAETLMGADGPAVTFLHRSGTGQSRRWERCVTWVALDTNLRLIRLMIQQLENLWTIAYARYTGSLRTEQVKLYLMTSEDVVRAVRPRPDDQSIPIHSVSIPLDYLPSVDAS